MCHVTSARASAPGSLLPSQSVSFTVISVQPCAIYSPHKSTSDISAVIHRMERRLSRLVPDGVFRRCCYCSACCGSAQRSHI